jgi:predicted HD phosphohydrolase
VAVGPRARGVTVPASGDNGVVEAAATSLSIDEIIDLLARGAGRPLRFGAAVTQLDHALQTATLLLEGSPDDPELAAAGLVHDLGHLMPGVSDDRHSRVAAASVRAALGDRVADLVEMHVDAKRYLVAIEPDYGNLLAGDSVASLREQGGPMSADEVAAFAAQPLAADAVRLRRADDNGKADGRAVQGLADWAPFLRRVAELQEHAAG